MTETDTVTLTRSEYQALIARTEEFEDALAAPEANDGSRIPHGRESVVGNQRVVVQVLVSVSCPVYQEASGVRAAGETAAAAVEVASAAAGYAG